MIVMMHFHRRGPAFGLWKIYEREKIWIMICRRVRIKRISYWEISRTLSLHFFSHGSDHKFEWQWKWQWHTQKSPTSVEWRSFSYRQECRGHDPTKKNVFYWWNLLIDKICKYKLLCTTCKRYSKQEPQTVAVLNSQINHRILGFGATPQT